VRAVVGCRAFLDEVVRQPVELGYPEWVPPTLTPPRPDTHMSPLGGPAHTQSAGEWSAASAGQYEDRHQQQQYGAANGTAGQYARTAGGPAAGRYSPAAAHAGLAAQQLPPAAAAHGQVGLCHGCCAVSYVHMYICMNACVGITMCGSCVVSGWDCHQGYLRVCRNSAAIGHDVGSQTQQVYRVCCCLTCSLHTRLWLQPRRLGPLVLAIMPG